MAKNTLVKYIKEQIDKGFDRETIKNHLVRYGYSAADVDDAVKQIYSPEVKHIIHFSPTTLVSIAVIFLGVVSVAYVFFNFFDRSPDRLLDLNLEDVKTTSKAGSDITFLTEITNLGSDKRYDIVIKYEVINLDTSKVLTFKEETRGIETIGSKQTKISIPTDADAGDYILRAIATYDSQRAVATLPVKIEGDDKEEPVDEPVQEPVKEPDKPIEEPEKIEEPEEPKDDPGETKAIDALTTFETIEKVGVLAKQDKSGARELCTQLQLQTSRDLCFNKIGEITGDKTFCGIINDERTKDVCLSNVAKFSDTSEVCEEITKDSRKDSCYMNFVIDKKDYTVCVKVTNQYLKQSCESLKQLSKLNITDVAFYEALLNQSLEFV